MLVLHTQFDLTPEAKEVLRSEVKKHLDEDCIILDRGTDISELRLKREQPLWRRLFRRT